MSKKAFPVPIEHNDEEGMDLLDYFAIHCDQPGQSEIVTAAGLVFKNWKVWSKDNPDVPLGDFNSWWSGLPNEVRYALYAKVRYQLADAMMKERRKW